MEALRIGIVEDQSMYRHELHTYLTEWSEAHYVELNIQEFQNGETFFRRFVHYHIVFIDIKLSGGENGIDIARRLRKNHYTGEIVFITNYREYMLDGYDVHAFQYLLKPVEKQKLMHTLNDIYSRYKSDYYTVFSRGKATKIKYNNITYVTSSNHNVDIHIYNEETVYSPKIKFIDIMKVFPNNFKQCHRTILVNMNYVNHVCKTELGLINGIVLPVSATYLPGIQKAIIAALKEQ